MTKKEKITTKWYQVKPTRLITQSLDVRSKPKKEEKVYLSALIIPGQSVRSPIGSFVGFDISNSLDQTVEVTIKTLGSPIPPTTKPGKPRLNRGKGKIEGIDRVYDAWNNPGSMPSYHRQWQNRLRDQWPTLAIALDALNRWEE